MASEHAQCPVHDLEHEYNPFAGPQVNDPYPVWDQARHEQPVFYSEVLDAWVVTRYEDMLGVLRDPGLFGQDPGMKKFGDACPEADEILAHVPSMSGNFAVASDPPLHTKLRRYLQPAFQPQRIAPMEPELRRLANALIDELEPRGRAEFYSEYAYRFPLSVVSRLINLPEGQREQVKQWASLRLRLRHTSLTPDEQVVSAQASKDFHEFCLDLVARRRAEPGDDMLSWIVQDSDASDDPLTEDQLASQMISVLTAGHETTALWLTIALHHALADRSLWAAIVADPSSDAWVEESLRLDGPVRAIWRWTQADAEVNGIKIPAGARVSIPLPSANADETVFESPEVFDATRSNIGLHMAFGRGIHTCVGAQLARMEGRITFEALATRLPQLRLAEDDGFEYQPSASTRLAQRLHLEWT